MIELKGIDWSAGAFSLFDVSFQVPARTYAVLMGATGSGKTTIIEMIAGLRMPQAGQILIDGRDITRLAPGQRGIGYVPQDGALFPTMTVREQLGFAPRIRRRPVNETTQKVDAMARELGIEHLLDRQPRGLSGGERQRVALGRALLADPKVLLLDEPLSALDESTRGDMIALLKKLQKETGVIALHITHSRAEAEALADQLWVLKDGVLQKSEPLATSS